MFKTKNNATTYHHSLNHNLEFFSKAGSLFSKRKSAYGPNTESSALELFISSWAANKIKSMQLLFWVRDIRGGAGNRSGFREIITWLAQTDPEWLKLNIELIPTYGRWDDLFSLYDTKLEVDVLEYCKQVLHNSRHELHGLACKWTSRKDNKLRKYLNLTPKEFRKLLVKGTDVVETKMCDNLWERIEYSKVPALALSRYSAAFKRKDNQRFEAFKQSIINNEQAIKVTGLFPHDCVRAAKNGDIDLATLQFEALPDFIKDKDEITLVMVDSSGSMSVRVSGSTTAFDIATGLGLYFSSRLDVENPFYKKILQFSSHFDLLDWSKYSFKDLFTTNQHLFNGYVGSTNIQAALDGLLMYAKMFNVGNKQMPKRLVIISDMQFDQGSSSSETAVEESINKWAEAGYDSPKIVYWNTAGYKGNTALASTKSISMVSGFSPAILQSVLKSEDLSPEGIMDLTLEKYKVNIPS